MKTKLRYFLGIAMLFFQCSLLLAQKSSWKIPTEPYFQQQVNNVINVTLDDSLHTLTGEIIIEYINNAPTTLNEMYIHLWANAYKDRSTAFAQQRMREGNTKFYYAEEAERGNFQNLSIYVDGQQVNFVDWEGNQDIAYFKLPFGLEPKKKMTMRIPFTLKIPESFSRLGHVGESYQLTQWFPKPAVYDRDGWHPMPYLHMGEFYSEFGDYEVNITLPSNYVVAATGTLQNDEELQFINSKIQETKERAQDTIEDLSFPPSSDVMKTVTFKAQDVHDFGWFADKRFYVEKGEVALSNGKIVETYVYYTDTEKALWQDALSYVDRSVKFYSDKVGNYPYPHATAVQSALSAGGGMEYPMITVIGTSGNAQALDAVITHEVGHNWFYGILGFNERDHTWLDEGINSYYDHRYTQEYYPGPMTMGLPPQITKNLETSVMQFAVMGQIKRGHDQAPSLHANDFESTNYFFSCYEKPALAFEFLEQYLGEKKFDRIMQDLYKEWEFKHPGPGDVIEHFNRESGENLDWFFNGFIYSADEMNYALSSIKKMENGYELKIRNKGDIDAPFPVTAYKDGKAVKTEWYEAKQNNEKVSFPGDGYDYFVIDSSFTMLDINMDNNYKKSKGLSLPKIGFITGFDNMKRKQLYLSPIALLNQYDGVMLGLHLNNLSLPLPKWKMSFNTGYGFKSRKIVGTGRIQYDQPIKKGILERITYKVTSRRFSLTDGLEEDALYETIVPSVAFSFDHGEASPWKSVLELKSTWAEWGFLDDLENDGIFTKLSYSGQKKSALYPFDFNAGIEYMLYDGIFDANLSSLKIDGHVSQGFEFMKNKTFNVRLYGGFFPIQADVSTTSSNRTLAANANINLVHNGNADHAFEDFFLGRTDFDSALDNQVVMRGGAFKLANIAPGNIGQSNVGAFALNVDTDIPIKFVPNYVKLYVDYGQYFIARSAQGGQWETIYSGGIMLNFRDAVGIYIPVYSNDVIRRNQTDRTNFFNQISFTLDLNKLDIIDLYNNFRI